MDSLKNYFFLEKNSMSITLQIICAMTIITILKMKIIAFILVDYLLITKISFS